VRNVIVTGGTRGIGRAIVDVLRVNNSVSKVVFCGTTKQSVADALSENGWKSDEKVLGFECDVTSETSVGTFIDAVSNCGIPVDVLVNNAGIANGGVTKDQTFEQWKKVIDTNLHSVFLLTAACLKVKPFFHNQREGKIINIASTAGKQGIKFGAAYSASKHGVVGFTKSLGFELASSQIAVNAVCPGYVETDIAKGNRSRLSKLNNISEEEVKKSIENRIPIGRYVQPQEVARLVSMLISMEGNGVTGQAYNICGGLGNY